MSDRPPELDRLLRALPSDREAAWQAFVGVHSRLLLHVARSIGADRDDMMDAYTFVLDALRANDSTRLRGFAADGRSKFSTWLVVVARRLCLDFRRQRFGRSRVEQSPTSRDEQRFRRKLGELAGDDVDLAALSTSHRGADDEISALEIRRALADALNSLEASDRLLLKLRFEDELSAQQIARLMHSPSPFHVYRRLEAVTKAIRRLLVARGVEGATP